MTDDLEPRLTDHLRQRAARVSAPGDLADVHERIDSRARSSRRALGAALAVALVAGPVTGWAVARSTEGERETVSVGPGGSPVDDTEGGTSMPPWADSGYWMDYLGPALEARGERTTDEGIHLSVRVGKPYGAYASDPAAGCQPDSVVRVGVTDDDGLVGVATMESRPRRAAFAITGAAEGRLLWVVAVRTDAPVVRAVFINGAEDEAEAVDGLAVLAAYAEGADPEGLLDSMVRVYEGQEDREVIAAAYGDPECEAVINPPATPEMPEPGDPPADEDAARAEITELFSMHGGVDGRMQVDLHEEPEVWLDAQQRFQEEQPEYFAWAAEVYGEVHEIVFTAPDRATVRYSLVTDNPEIPAPGERIGEAVLIDGMWKVSIETACGNLALAGIQCDHSLGE